MAFLVRKIARAKWPDFACAISDVPGDAIADKTLGDTIVLDLINTHRDLSSITYDSLGLLSEIIINAINNKNCKLYTKTMVKKILVDAYNTNRINESKCDISLLDEIKKLSIHN